MSIPMITINYFDPYINKVLGSVYVHHTESISLGRDFFASAKGMFGGPSPLFKKKINDTIKSVITSFKNEVMSKYPNASSVIGLKIELLEFGTETTQRVNESASWLSFFVDMFSGGDEDIPKNYKKAEELIIPKLKIQEGGGGSYIVATMIGNVLGPI